MLAETDFDPPWDWPREATIESVRSETREPVDDILVSTSLGGQAYIQAKRSLTLQEAATSELGKTMGQFVDQYLDCRDRIDGRDPLVVANDRLILAVGSTSSAPIREHLAAVVERIRNWPSDRPLAEAPVNASETRALAIVTAHINREFRTRTGADASHLDLRQIFALMRVSSHDFRSGGHSERETLALIRTAVVMEPGATGSAWHALCRAAEGDAVTQSGMDRRSAQEVLRRESIAIQAPRSYRNDIGQLRAHGVRVLGALEQLSDIRLADGHVKLTRAVPDELARLAAKGSCLVVGDPGAGKSATLYEFGSGHAAGGADLVALAADRLDAGSIGALRGELNLSRDIVEILSNWPTESGVLLIDALDAARGDNTQQALLDLIEETRRHAPHWKIVASIRRFDLRHNRRLRSLFPVEATPPADYFDPEFAEVGHLNVALLSAAELNQLDQSAPAVHAFVSTATEDMCALVKVPFNLRLLAELIDAHVDPSQLHPIHTQLELLDQYWQQRVLTPEHRADLREALLRRSCERMIETRTLRVNRAALQADPSLAALPYMLSAQVLVETESGGGVDRNILGFAHHSLFDYAAARLLLRRAVPETIAVLLDDRDLPIIIRPSLDLHLRWLWESQASHQDFWDLALAIAGSPTIPEIAMLAATAIAADMSRKLDDLGPLVEAVTSSDPDRQRIGERVLRHLLASVHTFNLPIAGNHAGPWTALAATLADT